MVVRVLFGADHAYDFREARWDNDARDGSVHEISYVLQHADARFRETFGSFAGLTV
jgi:hypothetical protein